MTMTCCSETKPSLATVQQLIVRIIDDGRERANLAWRLAPYLGDHPPPAPSPRTGLTAHLHELPDSARDAVQIAEQLAQMWGDSSASILVQLRGVTPTAHAKALAELMRPARIHVSHFRMQSNQHLPHPTDHTACFVHAMEPDLLPAHLTIHTGLTVTLEETY